MCEGKYWTKLVDYTYKGKYNEIRNESGVVLINVVYCTPDELHMIHAYFIFKNSQV